VGVSHFACFSFFLSEFTGLTMWDFHFHLFSVFLPQSRSWVTLNTWKN
jgi:hypothetical protein